MRCVLYTDTVSVRCFLYTDTVSVRCFLFTDTVSVRCLLFTNTLSVNNLFIEGNDCMFNFPDLYVVTSQSINQIRKPPLIEEISMTSPLKNIVAKENTSDSEKQNGNERTDPGLKPKGDENEPGLINKSKRKRTRRKRKKKKIKKFKDFWY